MKIDHRLTRFYLIVHAHVDNLYCAIHGRDHMMFHFHRLDRHKNLVALDLLIRLHPHIDYPAVHGSRHAAIVRALVGCDLRRKTAICKRPLA